MPLSPRLPSPVRAYPELRGANELWVKDDGALHPLYGGNKVRKLPRILARAVSVGARRILTFGPAGSHHVLTTALFAREYGLEVAAVLSPQPGTPHAEQMLRAIAAQGIELHAAPSVAAIPLAFARALRPGDYVVGPGGSNVLGALGYAEAAAELRAQITAGSLPAPDAIVVALGSGGTAGGLLAGLVENGLGAELIGVQTVGGYLARPHALYLARRVLARGGRGLSADARRFVVERSELGRGYGAPTRASERAARRAADIGLCLDPTYTAKAFAHALELLEARAGRRRVILYWHTLSAAPLEPLLVGAPALEALPRGLRALLSPVPPL